MKGTMAVSLPDGSSSCFRVKIGGVAECFRRVHFLYGCAS